MTYVKYFYKVSQQESVLNLRGNFRFILLSNIEMVKTMGKLGDGLNAFRGKKGIFRGEKIGL